MTRAMLWRAIGVGTIIFIVSACDYTNPGSPSPVRVPQEIVTARSAIQPAQKENTVGPKQILFGDLHVHTTFSIDAFLFSLPSQSGTGVHPPADACDFARFCSDLDFFSFNDHAEGLLQKQWQEIKNTTRACNELAGPPDNPDLVVFPGWEWTQLAEEPAGYYGHKNVIFRDTDEARLPARPISSRDPQIPWQAGNFNTRGPLIGALFFPLQARQFLQLRSQLVDLQNAAMCPPGVDTRKLPLDCLEGAPDPTTLFEKLGQWGFDTLVIPHGTSWGIMVPALAQWDTQLNRRYHDPEKQTLIEVYSGHGNSEEYRPWRPYNIVDGKAVCPAPTKDYLPCCWRAGEIIRARCANSSSAECEAQVAEAQQKYIAAGLYGHKTIPDATVEDWLDCGQCRDCFNPDFSTRPMATVQYALAVSNFDDPANVLRYRFGFLSSSDNHRAQPGTGYKEKRKAYTDAQGRTVPLGTIGQAVTPSPPQRGFGAWEFERQGSFFYTGGLVAVHSAGRNREAIWDALKRKEVYGTSGPRILLWVDLLNAPGGQRAPMGTEVHMQATPRFEVRAVGALKQKPGCPEQTLANVSPEVISNVCLGECYNPTDERYSITRIEVVRIRPQVRPGEPIEQLIDDPWQTLPCPGTPDGCVVTFEDLDFRPIGRDALYYVRAMQERTPMVNAGTLRCEYDAQGSCLKTKPCYADYRTAMDDDCLSDGEERAWSSPIFVNYGSPDASQP
jgi:hypothetical protein